MTEEENLEINEKNMLNNEKYININELDNNNNNEKKEFLENIQINKQK